MSTRPTGLQPPYFTNEGLDFRSRWGAVPKSDSVSLASASPAPKNYTLLTKCIAEFIGDFTFVFVGTMQAFVTQGAADNILHAALAHGLTIFILVASLGHISGGHFNPVVSWAVAINRKMPYYHFPFYMMSQLLGGICGAFMTAVLNNHSHDEDRTTIKVDYKFSESNGHIVGELNDVINRTIKAVMTKGEFQSSLGGATLLNEGNQWWQGFLSETVVSYFLVHTILLTAVDTDKNVLAPLAIGMTLTIDILATGKITGASMNPARSLGPNIVSSIFLDTKPADLWKHHYIYWAGPFLGSTIAALWFRLFESREERYIK
ncbi:unnamed protein product [Auanema sp. JU1783]|nr:unnamed protein product [Auanema sp. JU1783]